MAVFGHRKCRSEVEVVAKSTFDNHAHGNITRGGKVSGVKAQKLLRTTDEGAIVADNTISGDVTVNGTLTATKIVGAVYA